MSSSFSLTRWSSHAQRNTRRRSQCTSERSVGPTSSGQQSLTCSPSARRRVLDLAVDGEVHEVLELVRLEASADEPELERGLLAALGEVPLVEGEPELTVLEDEVLAGVVVAAPRGIHETCARGTRAASASYARTLPRRPP